MSAAKAMAEFASNDVFRFALAMVLVVGTILLMVLERDIPTVLWAMDASALGFYFGGVSAKMSG